MTNVLIPWRGGDPHRERARDYLADRYESRYRLIWAEYNDGPWCKARAIMPWLRMLPSEPMVVADADVWTEGLDAAIGAVLNGHSWAQPHGPVRRLTEAGTAAYMDCGASDDLAEPQRSGISGGGIVVAERDTLLRIPPDPRFEGWGHEDECWAMALTVLAGKSWRGRERLIHFHHPPQQRLTRRKGSHRNWELYKRYKWARRESSRMKEVVQEIHDAFDPGNSTLHHRAAA